MRRGPGLAGRLLREEVLRGVFATFLVLAMNACFVPQDDHLLPDVPEPRNRPLRILESTVTPSRLQSIGNGPTCQLTFSLRVEDPDINDFITVRWYVDYSAGNPTQPVDEDVLLNPGGKPQRSESAEYTALVGSATNPLHATGLHTVEAVVADGPLVGHDVVLPHPSQGDAGTNLSYIVTYGWVVDVVPEDCLAP